MATEQPLEVPSVKDEERFFGGDIVWWCMLLLVSIPVMLIGLASTPDTLGFFLLAIGGVMCGVGFAQVILRMPYITNGFVKSVLIALVAAAVICLIAQVFSWSLPVREAPQDVMFKPPISGG